MPNPDVSLVIVGYRTRDLLRACLESVYRETRGVTFEVVVVENASGDGSVEMIQREFPDVRLIALDENSGFARGTNLGAEAATGDAIILLNPDTEVVGNAVGQLAEFARAHPKAGVYGGRTVRPNGTLDPVSCGGRMSLWSVTCWALGLNKAFPNVEMFDPEGLGHWQRDTVRQVAMIAGCFMLINRDVWTTLGGFDEQFFMYGEDTDLMIRAARLGYAPLFTPDATVIHHLGASSTTSTNRTVMVLACRAQLMKRHWGGAQAGVGRSMLRLGVALRSAVPQAHNRPPRPWREIWRRRVEWEDGPAVSGRS